MTRANEEGQIFYRLTHNCRLILRVGISDLKSTGFRKAKSRQRQEYEIGHKRSYGFPFKIKYGVFFRGRFKLILRFMIVI